MEYRILAINPGSTSTKIAMYIGSTSVFERVIRHNPEEIKVFPTAASQYEYRFNTIRKILKEECVDLDEVDAFVGRGGVLKPLKGGTYIVTEEMVTDLKTSKYGDHASNLGAIIGAKLAEEYSKEAYVVNPVVVDELMDIARFSGRPELERTSVFHALNQKAIAMRAAADRGIEYDEGNFIVAHLGGGGISVGAHHHGKIIDVNNALEAGPFSPERAGTLPSLQLVDLCFSGRYEKNQIKKMIKGNGGLIAYTGTSDCQNLVIQAETDKYTQTLLQAMAYQISKEICANAAALCGEIDCIVITGGIAYSTYIVEEIKKRVSFLGSVMVYPGEDELTALVEGVIRVLEGKEKAYQYHEGWVETSL